MIEQHLTRCNKKELESNSPGFKNAKLKLESYNKVFDKKSLGNMIFD